jgi:hypothetical protein
MYVRGYLQGSENGRVVTIGVVRSLQDRIAFIISINQHNKFIQSVISGRFWQFVYKENVRCTRVMQRSLQVVIRKKFVLWML